MTRSFSHYTDGNRVYLSKNLKIFFASDEETGSAPSRAGSLPHLQCISLLAKAPTASTQNNQMPQNLMLLKPQHALQ